MGKKETAPLEGHVSGQANKPLTLPAHSLTLAQVVDELSTETWTGLDDAEAKRRLDDYGPNELGEAEGVSVITILIAQVANAMTLILIMAMAVSYGIGSYIEGAVVTFVILLNIGELLLFDVTRLLYSFSHRRSESSCRQMIPVQL
jgi:Na+-exporting ATPase